MAQIKWTPQSLDDVEAIANFIARDSEYYARNRTLMNPIIEISGISKQYCIGKR